MRLGHRPASKCMVATIALTSFSFSGCSAPNVGTALMKVDLQAFGYQPHARGTLADYTDVAFLSEDQVAISINQIMESPDSSAPRFNENQHANVLIADVSTGRVLRRGDLPVEAAGGAVQALSNGRLAVWNEKGLQVCTTDLRCGTPVAGFGPLSVSPKGRRILFGGYRMSSAKLLDADSLRELATFDDTAKAPRATAVRDVIVGDSARLISCGSTTFAIQRPGIADKVIEYEGGGSFASSEFLNDQTFAYIEHNSRLAVIADLSGRTLRTYKLNQAYRTGFLRAASGKRFGIYEYGFTPWNSLINLFDYEETRCPNFQRVRIVDLASGVEVDRLEWNPQQDSSRDLIHPCLSPSGDKLARVIDGVLEVVRLK